MSFEPRYGDGDNTLLFKIANLIAAGSGGGGVTSFNARVGAVTLLEADVTALVDSRYVLKSGDTMTGLLTVNQGTANLGNVSLSGGSLNGANTTPFFQLTGTWNTTGTPRALLVNITDISSNSGRLVDFQTGGSSRFSVQSNGFTVIGPAANVGALSLSGSVTGAASTTCFQISPNWNTTGNPTALLVNVGATASGASSLLLDLQYGGVSKFAVGTSGITSLQVADEILVALGDGFFAYADGSFGSALSGLTINADGTVTFPTDVGFFGTAPAAQQVSGANLTNNVTSGGTDNVIANYTDLTIYANDAAAIRNDIYQLARKLKQVNDALRVYGLLT